MEWLKNWALLHGNDVAQILVLAVLLYIGLRFIRGTRGAGVLRGVVIIFIVIFVTASILTNIAGFEAIHYLLTQFVNIAAVLLIIVVFQPELRHGLVRLGSNPFLRSLFRTEQQLVQEVAESAGYLSRNRIGALVVLARQVHLQGFIERGVRLDAEVSAELLNAVFQPTSPLEDGAVIIQDQRLAAACCILPLTENPTLSRTLGTRHRAALGVTEESDAVAVVVSEQTGNISVAYQGELTANVDPDHLRGMLQQLLTGKAAREEALEEAKENS
jgi:diadenylate cyclase